MVSLAVLSERRWTGQRRRTVDRSPSVVSLETLRMTRTAIFRAGREPNFGELGYDVL